MLTLPTDEENYLTISGSLGIHVLTLGMVEGDDRQPA